MYVLYDKRLGLEISVSWNIRHFSGQDIFTYWNVRSFLGFRFMRYNKVTFSEVQGIFFRVYVSWNIRKASLEKI